jgi:hypothetical protein
MSLPALPSTTDIRSITERANAIIKQIYNAVIPVGADGTVLTSDGTTLAWEALPTATDTRLLQVVSTQTGAVATGTTLIPADDSIPQSGEGDQYMSLAITPKSATSRLVIDVSVFGGASGAPPNAIFAALFQDSTANALAAGWTTSNAGGSAVSITFRHVMTSGTTSSTTFKVRVGAQNAGTFTFNGVGGARFLGGVLASGIVIREVLP